MKKLYFGLLAFFISMSAVAEDRCNGTPSFPLTENEKGEKVFSRHVAMQATDGMQKIFRAECPTQVVDGYPIGPYTATSGYLTILEHIRAYNLNSIRKTMEFALQEKLFDIPPPPKDAEVICARDLFVSLYTNTIVLANYQPVEKFVNDKDRFLHRCKSNIQR